MFHSVSIPPALLRPFWTVSVSGNEPLPSWGCIFCFFFTVKSHIIFILDFCIEVKSQSDKTGLKIVWIKWNTILSVIYNVNFRKCDHMSVTCVMQSNWLLILFIYDMICSPMVIGNLWSVTDSAVDAITVHTLHNWLPVTQEMVEDDPDRCSSIVSLRSLQMEVWTWLAGLRPATSWVHYKQAVTHSLVLLKMGGINARNMLSWLELLINRYCCI